MPERIRSPVRVVLVVNPRSGAGRAAALARQASEALGRAGVAVEPVAIGPGLPPTDLAVRIAGADAVAVTGGDGTVLSTAPAAVAAGVPIYHLPAGNENLFSREFGMSRNPARLIWALRRGRRAWCDVGECRWESPGARPVPFLLMASIGPDASVVGRLHATRTRATGHAAYLWPLIDEAVQPCLPRVRAWCDGDKVIDGRGMLIVANSRQYAFRMDPCHEASIDDGELDLAFIPAETSVDVLAGLARLRLRWASPDIVRARGRVVRVEVGQTARVQVDGEHVPCPDCQGVAVLQLSVQPRVLPVLDAR